MKLLSGWMLPSEVDYCEHLTKVIEWSTVRGPFRMAPLDSRHTSLLPSVVSFLNGSPAHGAYLLSYGEGAYKGPHVDPSPNGVTEAHHRIVCLVHGAEEGGDLVIEGKHAPLAPGDAVLFRADLDSHCVTPVLHGHRLVLTVGTLTR